MNAPPSLADLPSRWYRWFACVLAFVCAAGAAAGDLERWYIVRMEGQHAGWMSISERAEGDRVLSRSSMSLSVARGSTNVSISMEGEFVEGKDGTPLSMSSTQKLGNVPVESRGEFKRTEHGVELSLTTTQQGSKTRSTTTLPSDGWLAPAAAARSVARQLTKEARDIVVRTLDPTSGPEIETITRRNIERARLNVGGRSRDVFKCESSASSAPGINSIEYLDADGTPVKFTANLGGIALEFEESSKDEATRSLRPPEVMVATFVRPDRPIDLARARTRATYTLAVPQGELPAIPATGTQRSEAIDPRRARVSVGVRDAAPQADSHDRAFVIANSMINSEDPEIRELAARALKSAPADRAARAERLRRFVHGYITRKDLDTALASASEVARTHAGDCTEHAVLLAALLRADGIPSRIVSGLIYADRFAGAQDVFAYHMWTQALLDSNGSPSWIDLDATLSGERAFDATHIAIMTSAMEDGKATGAMASIVPLLGRLSITVDHVE